MLVLAIKLSKNKKDQHTKSVHVGEETTTPNHTHVIQHRKPAQNKAE